MLDDVRIILKCVHKDGAINATLEFDGVLDQDQWLRQNTDCDGVRALYDQAVQRFGPEAVEINQSCKECFPEGFPSDGD